MDSQNNQNNQNKNNLMSNFSDGNNSNQSQNNQRPFLIWTVAILVVLILVGGLFYFWQNSNQGINQQKVVVRQKKMAQKNNQKNNQNSKQEINQQGKKIGQNNNNSKAVDPTANWKTYRNEKYGFEMKYPKGWRIIENKVSDHPEREEWPLFFDTSISKKGKDIVIHLYINIASSYYTPNTYYGKLLFENKKIRINKSNIQAENWIVTSKRTKNPNISIFIFRVYDLDEGVSYVDRIGSQLRHTLDQLIIRMLQTTKFYE